MEEGQESRDEIVAKSANMMLWFATSALMSMVHNVNCMKRSDQKPPNYFNPLTEHKSTTRGIKLTRENVVGIFSAFAKQKHDAN